MSTKKNQYRKMIGKGTGAGLAAGKKLENKAQQNADAAQAARKTSNTYNH
ncbi:hypothetical protein [Alistipes finegoldii]